MEKFEAITGPVPVAIAAPEQKTEPIAPVRKPTSQIIDGDIPFGLVGAVLLPFTMLMAGTLA